MHVGPFDVLLAFWRLVDILGIDTSRIIEVPIR